MPQPRNNPNALQTIEKLNHPARPPPAFWDNLSSIPLINSALRELERRNKVDSFPRRPIPRRITTQYLSLISPAQFERIKRFARIGGPDLSDLRGFYYKPSSVLRSHLSRRKRDSASALGSTPPLSMLFKKSIGPYDRAFEQHLIDHGIYPNMYKYPDGQEPLPPGNLDEIMQIIAQPRPSLSPSCFTQEDFENFERKDVDARKEWQVISDVVPIIEGEVSDNKCVAGQVPFKNLKHLTDGSLVPGNPDRYYGARPEQLDREVRTQLNKRIVPSTQHDLPVAPNFFLTVKGPDGSPGVAERQACYDGALGARGMNSLQTYGDPDLDPGNNAYTLTSSYHMGTLKIYASYTLLSAGPRARPEYVMKKINSWSLTGDARTFRQGVAAYRNARDWARQKRDEAINKANKIASDTR
ncbi:hypothetical protein HD806DRAFT_551881 [Xylariaceae sp. AK1471]|nr:hypothetical protein HD806DRAFT_551881 [Xylariaceae sp. AK1471]